MTADQSSRIGQIQRACEELALALRSNATADGDALALIVEAVCAAAVRVGP